MTPPAQAQWTRAGRGATVACLLVATVVACTSPAEAAAGAAGVESFSAAKRALRQLYSDHRVAIYSGCAYDEQLRVTYDQCGYRPRRATARSQRVEWEHVVPAEAFGQTFAEWREGHPDCIDSRGRRFKGRHCAAKTSELFRRMEADMHNLYPEIGELNARRSNFSMAELPSGFMLAGVGVKVGDAKFEPRPEAKGDVARTYLYMDQAYPGLGLVSAKNKKLFAAWSRMDPVDAWECERARRIAAIQGRRNPIVEEACARHEPRAEP